MKLEKLVGERFKERPADCVIDSHAIMVKGGYIKYMANGIYSSYLPLRRQPYTLYASMHRATPNIRL